MIFARNRFPGLIVIATIMGIGLGAVTGTITGGGPAKADTGLVADEEAIRALVLETIRDNPEIVMEAIDILRARQEEEAAIAARNALETYRPVLEQDPSTPVFGNPDGDITIVEFFDYRCGYCKRVFSEVKSLLADDGNIRLVLKEFPILGPDSQLAATAALAVWNIAPEKYWDFHAQVMTSRGQITQAKLDIYAEELGLNAADLQTAMKDPGVTNSLQRNLELGQALGISGTPAFVIGDQIVPGAIDKAQFQELVAAVRADKG